MNIQDTIERALKAAGLNTTSGPMRGVTETIRKALSSAGLGGATEPPRAAPGQSTPRDGDTIEVVAREVAGPAEAETPTAPHPPVAKRSAATKPAETAEGQFLARSFSSAAGTRAYKLYLPPQAAKAQAKALPMVVMLHGCTQSADDFAAGTQMNRLADQHGFLVLYPEQAASANPSRCWNWFSPHDQVREGGEPALIAGMVQAVAAEQPVDPRRIYVAGLSAGAAMAVILGQTHPELFAAVGAHSGLPYAAAHDIPSAMAAMKGRVVMGRAHFPGTPEDPRRPATQAVPVIVFHGDRDHTVQQSNGDQIVSQALAAYASEAGKNGVEASSEEGSTDAGQRYTRTRHLAADGRCLVEAWALHGAGHAWSGGNAEGSFTDQKGPDASAEMLRFFLAQPAA
ncbi:PHB depolymerase family esterase [Hydrogenophaga aromaticivorans]|uniref:extracellular catalytic domain type 1 short-chain-length polyhydroxyalkanoate depolymerase n=1 Tax=Hydrogenophaga aromaticivorans TaxID=2610898 RepID=UPI001B37BAD9|nr:PHB depolymerase family esterase [Hydrogenophaga aromaticivorans]MBQ0921283.1 PHB depolymerase family esterase [Hydrogenophaga aromaticivorans]